MSLSLLLFKELLWLCPQFMHRMRSRLNVVLSSTLHFRQACFYRLSLFLNSSIIFSVSFILFYFICDFRSSCTWHDDVRDREEAEKWRAWRSLEDKPLRKHLQTKDPKNRSRTYVDAVCASERTEIVLIICYLFDFHFAHCFFVCRQNKTQVSDVILSFRDLFTKKKKKLCVCDFLL